MAGAAIEVEVDVDVDVDDRVLEEEIEEIEGAEDEDLMPALDALALALASPRSTSNVSSSVMATALEAEIPRRMLRSGPVARARSRASGGLGLGLGLGLGFRVRVRVRV